MENEKKPELKPLSEFSVDETGIIKVVNGEGRIRRRLLDMGIVPNTEVYMRKKAPLGDPIQITLRGYELSLRKAEAACVLCSVGEANENVTEAKKQVTEVKEEVAEVKEENVAEENGAEVKEESTTEAKEEVAEVKDKEEAE